MRDAGAVGRPFAIDRAADPALADLLAAGRRRQPCALCRARGEGAARRRCRPGSAGPRRRSAALIPIKKSQAWWELTQEERRQDFRGQVAAHRRQPEISARDRAAALSLPRSRRALRFPDLVRIRARACRAVRGTGGDAARHRGMELMSSARSMCAWCGRIRVIFPSCRACRRKIHAPETSPRRCAAGR